MIDAAPTQESTRESLGRDSGTNLTPVSFRDRASASAREQPRKSRREVKKVGILDKDDGAPGRTRTSTDVNPPDFESGASTNSATGASRRPQGRRRTARIIAKRPVLASRRVRPTADCRPADFPAAGTDPASHLRPRGASPRILLEIELYFRLFKEYLLYYPIYLIFLRKVLNYSNEYCIGLKTVWGRGVTADLRGLTWTRG